MHRLIQRVAACQRRAFSLKPPKVEESPRTAAQTENGESKNNYNETILFPTTNFPRTIPREEQLDYNKHIIYESGLQSLYHWQELNLSEPEFILHDGPPYANGPPHIGHAINKILKDIINRNHVIRGRKIHYVPGFDCHGLPIELEVLKNTRVTDPHNIRHEARKLAFKTTIEHIPQYQDWWVLADWKGQGCYYTDRTEYIQEELHCFLKLYEMGLIRRDFKPVHWSPSSGTALAESELVYNSNHKSTAAYVRFEMSKLPEVLQSFKQKRVYAMIWTTTPWTLVANQAVAFSESLTYCLAKDAADNHYILALDLLDSVISQVGSLEVQQTFSGKELAGTEYYHPINRESLPFLSASHVTPTEGTGLVHSAPAHGGDDFILAQEHNVQIVSVVDDKGCFTSEAGERFSGLEVMTEGTKKVLECIAPDILKSGPFTHKYAYDWRTNKPIIMRASYQWFIDLQSIKEKAIEALKDVKVYPTCNQKALINGLVAQIKQRPYWCISRQRCWGIYIPALYHKKTGEVLVSRPLIEGFCAYMDEHGPDKWCVHSLEEMFKPEFFKELGIDPADYELGKDILDIWFDSGVSWSVVLKDKVADLYLEGTDQFTGWFQSSLLTSIALRGRPPYKAIFAHGFAVDKHGKKMSKSSGNGVSPDVIIYGGEWEGECPAYGVDVLRWWVAGHACQHSMIPVKKELFAESERSVNKLRSIFYYLLGALAPKSYSPKVGEPEYRALDKFMLHSLYEYSDRIEAHYNDYAFHHVIKTVTNFLPNMVSALYITLSKDRLLFDGAESDNRRAVINVMRQILSVVTSSVAPIVPRLAEEVWMNHPESMMFRSIFRGHSEIVEPLRFPEIKTQVEDVLRIKKLVPTELRQSLLKHKITIHATEQDLVNLRRFQLEDTSSTSDLCELFGCVSVTLKEEAASKGTKVSGQKVSEALCVRCRRRIASEQTGLCSRCAAVVSEFNRTRVL